MLGAILVLYAIDEFILAVKYREKLADPKGFEPSTSAFGGHLTLLFWEFLAIPSVRKPLAFCHIRAGLDDTAIPGNSHELIHGASAGLPHRASECRD